MSPKSRLICRNITLPDGRTSIRLEPEVWAALGEICKREAITPGELAMRATTAIKGVNEGGRTSAIRIYILKYFRESATKDGHARAGHGLLLP